MSRAAVGDSLARAADPVELHHQLVDLATAMLGLSGQTLWVTFWLNVLLVVAVVILATVALRVLEREAIERVKRQLRD